MGREEGKIGIALLFLKIVHFCITIGLFYFAWLVFRYEGFHIESDVGYRYNYFIAGGYGVILYFLNRTYNAFLLGYYRTRMLAFTQFLAQFFSVIIVFCGVTVAWMKLRNPWIFLPMLCAQALIDIGWSSFGNMCFRRLHPAKKTILIYRNAIDKKRFGTLQGKAGVKLYDVVKEIQFDGEFSDIRDQLSEYEAVFVAGVNPICRNGILAYCKGNGIPGFYLPHVGDVIMQEARHIQSFDVPVLYVNRKAVTPEYAIVKRIMDIVFSLAGIILLSPLMLLTAVAIRLYDRGPAIYKQERLTKDGKRFKIWKFRSMRIDAERDGVARLSTGKQDDRITPIGRVIRKCRLDELPQLFNILIGDMSFVGPRPERTEIAAQYCKTMPEFALRLQVKAGLTGYAQVYGKYNTDPYEKLEFDLIYINNMNILTDIQLMFATFGILFLSESTEGVEEGKVTAMEDEK
ncbi:MAG: exopolysaccharide biosynthesis polyprenyl glycosylphosphotransferase [Lachnospiraceae bacterium]|nr:exopolysaccharide biosynthesis polyprenyl glycosylphosphotransferase [Lachnospiraceae bacterium]